MKNPFVDVLKRSGGAVLGALLLGYLAVGCASPGYERQNATAKTLAKASAEVQAESRGIDSTITALKALVSDPPADLKPQFRTYQQALKRLEDAAIRTTRTSAEVTRKAEAYLTEWEKVLATINYEYIRERSQARREEVRSSLDTVQRRYQEAQAAVDPLINYLRDIRVALASDLTPGGIAAIRNIATNAEDNAKKVQTALGNLDSDLQTLSQRLSSQGPTPPAQAK